MIIQDLRFRVQGLWFKVLMLFLVFTVYFSLFTVSYAAHPLITDDTGTQGKGRIQLEVNTEFAYDKERISGVTIKAEGSELATILSYGLVNDTDLIIGIPYQWIEVKAVGHSVLDEDGFSDVSVELKWRFYEKEGLSFAVKPGITIPTGDEDDGLGTGKMTYSLFFITTKEVDPWAFHLNLGYTRNENKIDERKNIWHVSLASELEVNKKLRVVGNIGAERNPDKSSDTDPAFLLGGLIYSISENFDIDVGIKGGLNKPETDLTFLAGIALRF